MRQAPKLLIKFLLLLIFMLARNIALAEEKVLNVYTWANYLPDSVIQRFEKETGIRINCSTYVNNEVLYAKLKANPESDYDIVMPSTYFIGRMKDQNLIQKIDKSKLTHFKNINPIFLNKEYDVFNEYNIPYLWTATGIAINQKYHPSISKMTSWQNFWDPQYKDQLLILDDTREVFSVALMTLGFSINDTQAVHIKEAFKKLKMLMKNIKLFNTEIQRAIYLDEDVTIGMGWNGDIYLVREQNPNLQFIYPTEGFIIALDCIAIPKGAKHVDYAHEFIDFVLRADIAKEIALESGFSTANIAAIHLLPEQVRLDPILYPDADTMKRGQILMGVGKEAQLYEKYFELLKLEE